MLRPYDPQASDLRRLDRIVADTGSGALYLVTFVIVYGVLLALHGMGAAARSVCGGGNAARAGLQCLLSAWRRRNTRQTHFAP